MSAPAEPAADPIACRRLDRPRSIAEHARCPYCFGDRTDIRSAAHDRFCDFEPGADPLAFGFPRGIGRLANR